MPCTPKDFVLALHSHLPYVLHHGRWPHGSDWLCEAALDTYLPLLDSFRRLAEDAVPAPVTIGFTPVLANQLASPAFAEEMERFFAQRLAACDDAPASLAATGDSALLPIVAFWRERLRHLRNVFRSVEGNLVAAFRALEASGRLEILGSAATHGFLPLLARDESIRLQLAVGVQEHRRFFGRSPVGCWLPECAYRPRGRWAPWPTAPQAGIRRGIDEHLGDAGFRYFFVDAHLATAGSPLGLYRDFTGDPTFQRFEAPEPDVTVAAAEGMATLTGLETGTTAHAAYRAHLVGHPKKKGGAVAVYVRDPRASMQVWSRFEGYPGDERYLEFHKMRWPGGLKLWRVSALGSDLGAKLPYDPAEAAARAATHAEHFAALLAEIAATTETATRNGVIVVPFDTELFGHWWFEGPSFLEATYRALASHRSSVRPVTGAQHLREHPPKSALRLPAGSWGAEGDFSMWLTERTAWTWERLWPLEAAFWDVARDALTTPAARPVVAQAARELLLAQSSDWQFIISTGAAADYAEQRFREHCDAAEQLVAALHPDASASQLEAAAERADELARRDAVFPNILSAINAALDGSRALAVD